jgi:hypothetical protein
MAVTELQALPMARKKRASEEIPPTVPVRIERSIAAKAKIVASDRGLDLAAYISDSLRLIVERDWSRIVKRIDSSGSEGE